VSAAPAWRWRVVIQKWEAASVTNPDPHGLVAVVWDDTIDHGWQIEVLSFMARTQMHSPDPDEEIQSWLDMASQSDNEAIKWALGVWQQFQTMPVFSCEMVLHECAALRAQHKLHLEGGEVK
jgi:hypothetical protein